MDCWYRGFCQRWSNQLSARVAQNLPKNRAKAVNPEAAQRFYSLVSNKVAELEAGDGKRMLPTHIWNTDESGFCRIRGKIEYHAAKVK